MRFLQIGPHTNLSDVRQRRQPLFGHVLDDQDARAPRRAKTARWNQAEYPGREIVRLMTARRWVMVAIVLIVIVLVLAETLAGGFW